MNWREHESEMCGRDQFSLYPYCLRVCQSMSVCTYIFNTFPYLQPTSLNDVQQFNKVLTETVK